MAKQKYVDLSKMEKEHFHYNLVMGERSSGKSFWVKRFCLRESFRNPGKARFVYLRRYQIESRAADVEAYFRDAPIQDITAGKYTTISVYRGLIYFSNVDPETGKIVRGEVAGYVAYLSSEAHFKSQNFNDVTEVIFEEYLTDQGYLWREPEKLQSFVSTVARKRKIRIWMIGNTINRTCPYFTEYGLTGAIKQPQGTLQVYEHITDQINEDGSPVVVKIGVYYTPQTENTSKMFFGQMSKMTTSGKWQTRSYPHMPYHYRDCRKVYNVLLRHNEFIFNIEAIKTPKNEYILFIHPHTGKTEGQRIIDSSPDPSPLVTSKLDPIRRGDKLISFLLNSGSLFFSDNLTGADWESVIKEVGGL